MRTPTTTPVTTTMIVLKLHPALDRGTAGLRFVNRSLPDRTVLRGACRLP